KSALEENVISSATLLKETKQHFWLQWEDSGKWIDLDPSLADSLPGKSLTVPDKTLDLLPDDLFHRVTIRIRVEEYEGSKYSSREVLNVSARAADLSGASRTLSHLPEGWKGPSKDLSSAISSAIGKIGGIKPVLSAGADFVAGSTFHQKPASSGGLGAMNAM